MDNKYVSLRDIKDAIIDLNGEVFLDRRTLKPIIEMFGGLPTIDIVSCVECQYKGTKICPMYKLTKAGVLKPYDFCSYGER